MAKQSNALLFIIPALIWGSTWYVIKFQLGTVDPLVSVTYRFFIAAVLMLSFCKLTNRSLQFTVKQHLKILLQGLLLFGFNYWLVYESEAYISSGLVAVGFSTIIFFNILFGAVFMKHKINRRVAIGAVPGLMGTAIIFQPELLAFSPENNGYLGLALMVVSVVIASLGNIVSAINTKNKVPVIQATGLGMAYSAIVMFIIALILGKEFNFDSSTSYVISLAYLAIFGSLIAFSGYLTLIGRIGPDKAAYTVVIVPVIAITISVIFEAYEFTPTTLLGMVLLIGGNVFALYKKKEQVTS
jgi:drug/metabolite transporter (DMT)-like permease